MQFDEESVIVNLVAEAMGFRRGGFGKPKESSVVSDVLREKGFLQRAYEISSFIAFFAFC